MNCFVNRMLEGRFTDAYNLCHLTHKFEVQYEEIFGKKSQKEIEADVASQIRPYVSANTTKTKTDATTATTDSTTKATTGDSV